MPRTALSDLRAQLGASLPASLSTLTDEQLRDLSDAIGAARRRQAQALAAAGDQALRHIPRLLRGPVKRVVG